MRTNFSIIPTLVYSAVLKGVRCYVKKALVLPVRRRIKKKKSEKKKKVAVQHAAYITAWLGGMKH